MDNIELYINGSLCDTGNNFGVRLRRQLINPAELNTKDSQMSYTVTLPLTPANDRVFNYTSVEETNRKFNREYNAELIINSYRIFTGKFRVTEINRNGYTGNLVVPAAKTVKDIFGDTRMSNTGRWIIPFEGLTDVATYNNRDNPECIFPLVLYGLLPKSPDNKVFTSKDVYDGSVKLGLGHIPPSVNVIQMLQNIFNNAGYQLQGSAIDDDSLKNLYVSYRNPTDYDFGAHYPIGKIELGGRWQAIKDGTVEKNVTISTEGRKRAIINFFNASNKTIDILRDNGQNITSVNDRLHFTVPATGLYKLTFITNFLMPSGPGSETPADAPLIVEKGNLNNVHTEIKIIRNLGTDLNDVTFDNIFYRNNQDQNAGDSNAVFPKKGEVNFIDPLVNLSLISGFAFGKYDDTNFINPLNGDHCNPMAIKGGFSWSRETSDGTRDRAYSAVQNSGYAYANGTDSGRFKVDLDRITIANKAFDYSASGELNQVVWLEKGDRLDIIGVSFAGDFPVLPTGKKDVIYNYDVNYTLTLEPFSHHIGWLKMDNDGASTAPMKWGDTPTFLTGEMDLTKFLPNDITVDAWIDNFCKAFNLKLENRGDGAFELNIKNTEIVSSPSNIVDLDKKADVRQRANQALGLPYMYDIGFTIDTNEQGYRQDMQIDDKTGEPILNTGITGGGRFYTSSLGTDTIQQVSTFSYNWYKWLFDGDRNKLALVPVITDAEIWENDFDYEEMMEKEYFDKAQRFWFKAGVKEFVLNNIGGIETKTDLAIVKNSFSGNRRLILDYEDKEDSILRRFFLLLTDHKHYTVISCYLSPDEYNRLHNSPVRFNGDIYYVADIDEYDPLNKNMCTIKLIRQI